MNRRHLVLSLGAAAVLPWRVLGQPARKTVVVLFAGEEDDEEPAKRPFFDEMRRLGWIEGGNVEYERHYGRGTREYMVGLAKSAASRAPDLIYCTASNLALAVVAETKSVPVVFTAASDPVRSGLVASLSRPGGNATGAWQASASLVQKRIELMREAFPGQKRYGVLLDRRAVDHAHQKAAHEEASRALKLQLELAEFTNFEAVAKHLANFRRQGIGAAKTSPSVALAARRREVAETAVRNKVGLLGHNAEWTEVGALLSYGQDSAEVLRRSAGLADRVLKGARPADTPVVEANRVELVVNQRTAAALGLTLPQALVRRADRVVA
jgi:putative tryptophan/tyrosine transport system substrate-binding protein